MCIIHDHSLHYLFQNIMEAFEKSKMLSSLFLSRVGCLICTCRKELLYDSKTLIPMQRSLYNWFDEALSDSVKSPIQTERLLCFKTVVEELKSSGRVDSGTKITFLRLLRDLDSFDYSKLRRLVDPGHQHADVSTTTGDETSGSSYPRTHYTKYQKGLFFVKLVILKFDLKFCSAKEFVELLGKLDNGAIKYIEITHHCRITLRDLQHLAIRNFMGEIEATIESRSDKALVRAELSLKRLADSIHYRLAKQIPSCDSVCTGGGSFNNLKILLQSPVASSVESTPHDTSASSFNDSANTTCTTTTSNNTTTSTNFENNTTTTANDDSTTTTDNNNTSCKSSDAVKNGKRATRTKKQPAQQKKEEEVKPKESEKKKKKQNKSVESEKKQATTTATAAPLKNKTEKKKTVPSKKAGGSADSNSDTLNESSGRECQVCTCDKGKKKQPVKLAVEPPPKEQKKEQRKKSNAGGKREKAAAAAHDRSINADDSSILDFSSRNDSMGGSTTPLTSSPVSSAGSRSPFRAFKETTEQRKTDAKLVVQQQQQQQADNKKHRKSSSRGKKTTVVHTVVA